MEKERRIKAPKAAQNPGTGQTRVAFSPFFGNVSKQLDSPTDFASIKPMQKEKVYFQLQPPPAPRHIVCPMAIS